LNVEQSYAHSILERALAVLRSGDASLRGALDELPAPIYVTDAEGLITYYNPACIAMAGRTPQLGQDRWCVTWKLYTDDGSFLPHDECPMAAAIRSRAPVRNVSAFAERPDGSRVKFIPFPTPLFDEHGNFVGAVNLLLDPDSEDQSEYFRAQAARCRRLTHLVSDPFMQERLASLADAYESQVRARN
jgi:PAS domain-containing protein